MQTQLRIATLTIVLDDEIDCVGAILGRMTDQSSNSKLGKTEVDNEREKLAIHLRKTGVWLHGRHTSHLDRRLPPERGDIRHASKLDLVQAYSP
jgi:hypothetical protein